MKRILHFGFVVLIFLSCGKSQVGNNVTGDGSPSVAEIQKISNSIPNSPTVAPQKPRKVLVFSLSWGYKHKAIPFGKALFRLLGEKTGAYQPVVSDDISLFEPSSLQQFDAVVFNNTNNEIFLPENFDSLSGQKQASALQRDKKLKKSFINFLSAGKGLVVLHAGVASFRKWPEFGKIIGARFDNHPWVSGSTVTVKVEEPGHPLLEAFHEAFFKVTDEIYQFSAPYSRKNLRVLLSLDTSRTDMTVKNIHRTDGDFAMSWIKNYGKGRVFYCAFGHENHIYWDKQIVRFLLDGIQFAVGDLSAEAAPGNH